jgi:hypothetical protein
MKSPRPAARARPSSSASLLLSRFSSSHNPPSPFHSQTRWCVRIGVALILTVLILSTIAGSVAWTGSTTQHVQVSTKPVLTATGADQSAAQERNPGQPPLVKRKQANADVEDSEQAAEQAAERTTAQGNEERKEKTAKQRKEQKNEQTAEQDKEETAKQSKVQMAKQGNEQNAKTSTERREQQSIEHSAEDNGDGPPEVDDLIEPAEQQGREEEAGEAAGAKNVTSDKKRTNERERGNGAKAARNGAEADSNGDEEGSDPDAIVRRPHTVYPESTEWPNTVALCTMMKNEHPDDVIEWLQYHQCALHHHAALPMCSGGCSTRGACWIWLIAAFHHRAQRSQPRFTADCFTMLGTPRW